MVSLIEYNLPDIDIFRKFATVARVLGEQNQPLSGLIVLLGL